MSEETQCKGQRVLCRAAIKEAFREAVKDVFVSRTWEGLYHNPFLLQADDTIPQMIVTDFLNLPGSTQIPLGTTPVCEGKFDWEDSWLTFDVCVTDSRITEAFIRLLTVIARSFTVTRESNGGVAELTTMKEDKTMKPLQDLKINELFKFNHPEITGLFKVISMADDKPDTLIVECMLPPNRMSAWRGELNTDSAVLDTGITKHPVPTTVIV